MRRRITSILLAGMMILNSVPAYADADISGANVIYEESSDAGNEENTENHEQIQVSADEKSSFVCDNCGQPFTEVIPASGHSLTQKEHKDATCQEKGYDIQVCSVCQEEFRTELDIDPTAHQYDEGKVIEPTCSRDGYTLYTCTRCGSTKREDYRPSTPHDYEDTIVKATCQTQGYTLHQCKNCDYSYRDNYTGASGHQYKKEVVGSYLYRKRLYHIHM